MPERHRQRSASHGNPRTCSCLSDAVGPAGTGAGGVLFAADGDLGARRRSTGAAERVPFFWSWNASPALAIALSMDSNERWQISPSPTAQSHPRHVEFVADDLSGWASLVSVLRFKRCLLLKGHTGGNGSMAQVKQAERNVQKPGTDAGPRLGARSAELPATVTEDFVAMATPTCGHLIAPELLGASRFSRSRAPALRCRCWRMGRGSGATKQALFRPRRSARSGAREDLR